MSLRKITCQNIDYGDHSEGLMVYNYSGDCDSKYFTPAKLGYVYRYFVNH